MGKLSQFTNPKNRGFLDEMETADTMVRKMQSTIGMMRSAYDGTQIGIDTQQVTDFLWLLDDYLNDIRAKLDDVAQCVTCSVIEAS